MRVFFSSEISGKILCGFNGSQSQADSAIVRWTLSNSRRKLCRDRRETNANGLMPAKEVR